MSPEPQIFGLPPLSPPLKEYSDFLVFQDRMLRDFLRGFGVPAELLRDNVALTDQVPTDNNRQHEAGIT